jgi:hypothetical protein
VCGRASESAGVGRKPHHRMTRAAVAQPTSQQVVEREKKGNPRLTCPSAWIAHACARLFVSHSPAAAVPAGGSRWQGVRAGTDDGDLSEGWRPSGTAAELSERLVALELDAG